MKEHPPFGTAPIRCGRTRCSWRGHETDLNKVPATMTISGLQTEAKASAALDHMERLFCGDEIEMNQ